MRLYKKGIKMKKIFFILLVIVEVYAGSRMCGSGSVVRLLSDDNKGSRHQRFIIKEPSGRTLLVTHNIDLAPRVNSIRKGGIIKFCGDYEHNSKGGVIHWTHHDPRKRHKDGWLIYNGRKYQ